MEPMIIIPVLRINFVIKKGNSKYRITGKSKDNLLISNVIQPKYSYSDITIIKKISKFIKILSDKKLIVKDNFDFEKLNKIIPIINNNILLSPARNKTIEAVYISAEEINSMLESFMQKCQLAYYEAFLPIHKIFNKLNMNRKIFDNLDLYSKVYVLNELLKLLKCGSDSSDLRLLDESKTFGDFRTSSTIKKSQTLEMQSVTGFYTKQIKLV